jgi:hyperosmotically inducible protein
MKLSKSITWIAIALFAAALTAGCNQNDPSAESVGRKIDQAQENASKKMDQATAQVKEQAEYAGDKIDDATITAKVKTALIGEPGLKALQINVDTANGVVTLSGTVDSPTSVDRVTRVVMAVQGVKLVDNRLTVKQG